MPPFSQEVSGLDMHFVYLASAFQSDTFLARSVSPGPD